MEKNLFSPAAECEKNVATLRVATFRPEDTKKSFFKYSYWDIIGNAHMKDTSYSMWEINQHISWQATHDWVSKWKYAMVGLLQILIFLTETQH